MVSSRMEFLDWLIIMTELVFLKELSNFMSLFPCSLLHNYTSAIRWMTKIWEFSFSTLAKYVVYCACCLRSTLLVKMFIINVSLFSHVSLYLSFSFCSISRWLSTKTPSCVRSSRKTNPLQPMHVRDTLPSHDVIFAHVSRICTVF